MDTSSFSRINSSDHLSSIFDGLLCMESTLVTSDSLADHLGVLVDPHIRLSGSSRSRETLHKNSL